MIADTAASPLRCAIYTRVSTQEQGREGASLGVQLQACRRHAAGLGWVVADELQDVQSGLDIDRAAYQRTLGLARSGSVDVVLVWRLDRFGRDAGEALSRLRELLRLHVDVVSATEGEQTIFMKGIMLLLADEESRATSARVRPAMRERAEQGLWLTSPPFGYAMDPARPGRLVVREPEASIVREMFRRAAAGDSAYAITAWLNTRINPDGTPLRSPRGRTFTDTFTANVLRSRSYVGDVVYGLTTHSKIVGRGKRPAGEHLCVPGMHAALIGRETFEVVRALRDRAAMRGRPNLRKQLFLLTGLLTCGECGRAVCGQKNYTGKWAGNSWAYKCADHSHGRYNGRVIEAHVLAQVAALPLPDDDLAAVHAAIGRTAQAQPDRTADLQAQRRRHEDRRRRLTMHLADGVLTTEDYRAAIAEVEQAMGTLDRELAALPPRADAAALVADIRAWLDMARELGDGTLAAVLPGAPLEDQAAVVSSAIERIVVVRGQAPAITWHPWAEALLEARTASGPTG